MKKFPAVPIGLSRGLRVGVGPVGVGPPGVGVAVINPVGVGVLEGVTETLFVGEG